MSSFRPASDISKPRLGNWNYSPFFLYAFRKWLVSNSFVFEDCNQIGKYVLVYRNKNKWLWNKFLFVNYISINTRIEEQRWNIVEFIIKLLL